MHLPETTPKPSMDLVFCLVNLAVEEPEQEYYCLFSRSEFEDLVRRMAEHAGLPTDNVWLRSLRDSLAETAGVKITEMICLSSAPDAFHIDFELPVNTLEDIEEIACDRGLLPRPAPRAKP